MKMFGDKDKKVVRLQKKENRLVSKGNKAVDEGREKKADRLLKRAANVEDRKIKASEKMKTGGSLKPVAANQKGLAKLPKPVRNKMGYAKNGTAAKMKMGGMCKMKAKTKK